MVHGSSSITAGQFAQFISILWSVLKDMTSETAQGWLDNPKSLVSKFNEILPPIFKRDMRKEGWKLIGNMSRRIQFVSDVEPVSFLREGEDKCDGETMRQRASIDGNSFGQEDAEWLLAHQSDIPKEWRHYELVFPGTIWQKPKTIHAIPYLHWNGARWFLEFNASGNSWGYNDRILSFRK